MSFAFHPSLAPGGSLHAVDICTFIHTTREESLEVKSVDSGVSLQDLNPALPLTNSVTLGRLPHSMPQFPHV